MVHCMLRNSEAALLYIFTITLPESLFINLIIYLVQIQSKANVFIQGIFRGFSGVFIVFVNPDFRSRSPPVKALLS